MKTIIIIADSETIIIFTDSKNNNKIH